MTKPIMLSVSRGLLEHKDRMGPAIWEFLWFIDKVTKDVPDNKGTFDGIVLGGQPVSLSQIARDLKEHINTTQRNIAALESKGYIVKLRLPENQCSYVVTNSKKWFLRDRRDTEDGVARHTECGVGVTPKMGERHTEKGVANKETLQNSTKNSTKSARAKPVSLPEGFTISERVREWAFKNGFSQLDLHLQHFIGKVKAHDYWYADWDQAFMNAVQDDWAKLKQKGNANGSRAQQRQNDNVAAAAAAKRDFGLVG